MYRSILVTAAALTLLPATPPPLQAQVPEIPAEMQARHMPRQQLAGPRFGFTTFTGDVAQGRDALGKSRFMSQFGWQFEEQLISTATGHQALLEWIFLVGGVEQDEFNPSIAMMAGYRLRSGLEFGVGPNLSFSSVSQEHTTSMVAAVGKTVALGDLYLPFNVAFAFAPGGPRITALLGWIVG